MTGLRLSQANFTGAAGDLRVQGSNGIYAAPGDVDPDLSIVIQSATAPVAGWFIV